MKIEFEETDDKEHIDLVKYIINYPGNAHELFGLRVTVTEPPAPEKYEPLGELTYYDCCDITQSEIHAGFKTIAKSNTMDRKSKDDLRRLHHQADLCPKAVELLEEEQKICPTFSNISIEEGSYRARRDKFLARYHAGPKGGTE